MKVLVQDRLAIAVWLVLSAHAKCSMRKITGKRSHSCHSVVRRDNEEGNCTEDYTSCGCGDHSVKRLLCKFVDLKLILRSQVKLPGVVPCTCNPIGEEMETGQSALPC